MTITPAQIAPIAAQIQTALNQLNALITSPPGTSVTAPSASTITDAQGNVWSFGAASTQFPGTYLLYLNGVSAISGTTQTIEIDINGVLWKNNGPQWGGWWMWNGSGWTGNSQGPQV